MKGLLIKDIRLMANMKRSLLFILLIMVGMTAYTDNVSFAIIYLGLMGANFTSSTLGYDEFDNGYAFLFSLPVTRKGYAVEKYVFGLLMCLGGWLLGIVLAVASSVLKGGGISQNIIIEALIMFPVVVLMLSVLLPFHIKFGREKAGMIMISVAGGMFVLLTLAAKVLSRMDLNLDAAWESLSALGVGGIIMGASAVGIVFLLLSCRISASIMERKEF